jgi:hypothetical protein
MLWVLILIAVGMAGWMGDGFGSLTKAVAVDCEMVGVGAGGSKSALGRVTLVSTVLPNPNSIHPFVFCARSNDE